MTGDTFTERRGYVKKSSGLGGSILFIVALAVVVGAAGIAGLHYGAAHGWDQPTSQGPTAPEPAVPVGTEAPTAATDQVETTSATLDVPAATASAAPTAEPVAEKPKPKPYVAPRPKPKAEPTSEAPTADPFATQQ